MGLVPLLSSWVVNAITTFDWCEFGSTSNLAPNYKKIDSFHISWNISAVGHDT